MKHSKITKLLSSSVSGFVLAACLGDAAFANNFNVGTASSNTGVATAAGAVYLFNVNNGTLTNSGTITSTTGTAVSSTSVTGSTINNAGTISTTGSGSVNGAINIGNGGGTITNSGTISATNGSAVAATGTAAVSITNTGTISSAAAGTNGTVLLGASDSITNSGTVSATTGTGILASGTGVTINNQTGGNITASASSLGAIVTGGTTAITNSGTITGVNIGINVATSTTGNTITNSGTITATNNAIRVATGATGTVINNTGTISSTATTSALGGTVDIAAGTALTNSGTISAVGTSNAVRVATGSTSASTTTINNQSGGAIRTTGAGEAIIVSAPITSITNSGTIESTTGTAILVGASGALTSGITNEATGRIIGGGAAAIDNRLSTTGLTINNAGTITGDVLLGNAGVDTVNISGGTITGAITGLGSNDIVNVTGNFTTGGIISGVSQLNASGGTLTLANNVAATTVANTSRIATTAARTITGNYTQSAAGTLQSAVTGRTTASLLTVSGTATLTNGATIRAQIADGIAFQAGDAFNVLTAGTLTATPAQLTVTDNDPFVSFAASSAANTLTLTASVLSAAAAQSGILTTSGFANTAALEAAAGGGTAGENTSSTFASYVDLLGGLRTANPSVYTTINSAFAAQSGESAVAALTTLQPGSTITTGNTLGTINASTTSGNVILARLENYRQASSGMAAGDKYGRDGKLFLQPFGSVLSQDRKDSIDGFNAYTGGFMFGGDVNANQNTRIGAAFGYNHTKVAAQGISTGTGSDINGYTASVYAHHTLKDYYIDALLGLGRNEYDARRYSTLFNDVATADFSGWQYNARIAAGYDYRPTPGVIVTPNAAFNYTYLTQDGYTESGSVINNNVNGRNTTSAMSDIGVKVSYPVARANGTWTPQARASWLHEFGDKTQTTTSNFVGSSSSFTSTGARIDEDAARIGLGLSYETKANTKVTADVDYTNRDTSDAVYGQINVKVPF